MAILFLRVGRHAVSTRQLFSFGFAVLQGKSKLECYIHGY